MKWRVMELTHVHGGVSIDEGKRLGDLAAQVPADEAIVEIGAYTGSSTSWLAMGSFKGNRAKVTTVDVWDLPLDGRPHRYTTSAVKTRFDAQLAYVAASGLCDLDDVRPIQALSVDVAAEWDQPIGLLHIDGMHTTEGCLSDLEAWTPHVARGGSVVVHDWSMGSVRKAVKAWLPGSGFERVAVHKWAYDTTSRGQWIGRRS